MLWCTELLELTELACQVALRCAKLDFGTLCSSALASEKVKNWKMDQSYFVLGDLLSGPQFFSFHRFVIHELVDILFYVCETERTLRRQKNNNVTEPDPYLLFSPQNNVTEPDTI